MGSLTPLVRASFLERVLGLNKLYLKLEGTNPTGTHKDRAAALHVRRAILQSYKALTAGTCGNLGASLAYFGRRKNLDVYVFVPAMSSLSKVRRLLALGAHVIEVRGDYEDCVKLSSEVARREGWYDANPGSHNLPINLQAYAEISHEIVKQLGDVPTVVSVPIGNGTTLAGIYWGFRELWKRGLIERVPAIVGSTTVCGNPVAYSWKRRLKSVVELHKPLSGESNVNELLISRIAFDGDAALSAIYDSGGAVYEFSDDEMIRAACDISHFECWKVLPASASAVLALKRFVEERETEGPYVAVITGRLL